MFLLRIFLLAILLFFLPQAIKAQTKKTVQYYSNGKVMEKGKIKSGQKDGIWLFYAASGYLEHKENWKEGKLKWAVYYNPQRKKIRSVDENGKETIYKACNCAPN